MESTSRLSHTRVHMSHAGTRTWDNHDCSAFHSDDAPQSYSPPQFERQHHSGSHAREGLPVAEVRQTGDPHYMSPQADERSYSRSHSWEGLGSASVSHGTPHRHQLPPAVGHAHSENSGHHHHSYGPPHMPYPMHTSSSYESYGSAHGPYPPQYVVSGPIVTYPFGPGMPQGAYYQSWGPPPKPIEYIRNIKSGDVLCGRGGATNSHPGNRSFRSLVKRHQDRYLRAKKCDKPSVASAIVELVRERGGRFLRRCDTSMQGDVLWVDIGDERAREKTCQALREGAPELRRRRRGASSSDEDEKDESPKKKIAVSRSEEQTSPKSDESRTSNSPAKVTLSSDSRDDRETTVQTSEMKMSEEGPLVIRPCSRLMRRPVRDIPLSELTSREQQMYMHDFLPPHPKIKESSRRKRILEANPIYSAASDIHGENSETWDI